MGDKLNIVEDIVDPLEIIYNLGDLPPIDTTTPLRGPNFKIDTRLNPKVSNEFKSFNDILSTSTTSSYQRLLSKLDGYEIPEIEYNYVRPVDTGSLDFLTITPSHFENFVHFGSATELLNNFKYKVELIELYNTQLNDIETITGATLQSVAYTNASASIKLKKESLIQGFSGYEQFLYFESGAYSWPKINTTEPYILSHTTSPESETWLGSGDSYNSNYGGQLLSASVFDSQNPNKLSKLVPTFIGDKEENQPYMLFCDMIGQHFDPVWTHIREITQLRDNSHTLGVSKDLVYYTLKTLGIEAYDQFENDNLIEYIFGSTLDPQDTSTVVTASNAIVSKQDISKEIWKRLYHNAPYLLKTKGTERGLRALINCYGIPETVLDIKEFGSSDPNRDEFKLYSYPKFTQVLSGNSITNGDTAGFFIETEWSSSLTIALHNVAETYSPKTVEFRITPKRTDDNYHLFSLTNHSSHTDISGSDLHLVLHPYTGSKDFFTTGDKTQYGKLELMQFTSSLASSSGIPLSGSTSPYFPAYNGSFWNISLSTDGISGSNTTASFSAYQANHLREVNFYTGSAILSEKDNAQSFGNPYYNSGNYIGGVQKGFFGGIKNITSNGIVTQSFYQLGTNAALTGRIFGLGYNGWG